MADEPVDEFRFLSTAEEAYVRNVLSIHAETIPPAKWRVAGAVLVVIALLLLVPGKRPHASLLFLVVSFVPFWLARRARSPQELELDPRVVRRRALCWTSRRGRRFGRAEHRFGDLRAYMADGWDRVWPEGREVESDVCRLFGARDKQPAGVIVLTLPDISVEEVARLPPPSHRPNLWSIVMTLTGVALLTCSVFFVLIPFADVSRALAAPAVELAAGNPAPASLGGLVVSALLFAVSSIACLRRYRENVAAALDEQWNELAQQRGAYRDKDKREG